MLDAKSAVGKLIASRVKNGMVLGLGTGSTAARAIHYLGERVSRENLQCVGVATSFAAEQLAQESGIPTTSLNHVARLDLAFDGADEVSDRLDLIKGRGGAHTREKVVAHAADEFVVLVDRSKMVNKLGEKMPVPIEVLPMASSSVTRAVRQMGGEAFLRMATAKDGPLVTDQGFWILDSYFGIIDNPGDLSAHLSMIPGVLDHGLFVGLASEVLVGNPDGNVESLTP